MKKIFRMIIFSGVSLYLTSVWNKGFIINADFFSFLKLSIFVALVYYFIFPFLKLIFLPLNIFTFGLASIFLYSLVFYFLFQNFGFILIKEWYFEGLKFFGFIIIPFKISYLANIFISSLSISIIIKLLERIL